MPVRRRKRDIRCTCSIRDGRFIAAVADFCRAAQKLLVFDVRKRSVRAATRRISWKSRCRESPLALNPREAGFAPATQRASMTQAVLVALETFKNIEGPRVSRSRRGPRCTVRALSAPAQEEDGSLAIGDGALQDIDKVRVSPSIG